MRTFLVIALLLFKGLSYGQGVVSGRVTSVINGKPLENVVISIDGTTTGVVTDSNGYYRIEIVSGTTTLSAKWLGYLKVDTTFTVFGDATLDLILNADCDYDSSRAQQDINTNQVKLLLVGSIAPIANSQNDRKFMRRYDVDYLDFGDNVIAMECIEDYNSIVFNYLDKTFGRKWRKGVRRDVIGLN